MQKSARILTEIFASHSVRQPFGMANKACGLIKLPQITTISHVTSSSARQYMPISEAMLSALSGLAVGI